MLPINRRPGVAELKSFARIWFPLFVAGFGAMLWWRAESSTAAIVFWAVGALVAAAVLASAEVARIVFVGLLTITYPIGLVLSTVALAIMFYGVFAPLGFFMRMAGRDPLRLRARDEKSHWIPYEQNDRPEQAFRQY
jgi:hypothetical protein